MWKSFPHLSLIIFLGVIGYMPNKLLSKKLPFRNNRQHSETCKKEKIRNVGVKESRQVIVVHKEMQNQQGRKGKDAYFSVKKHQHKTYHH